MSDKTKIEWADATLNYANGCTVVSPGCTNCYAMKQAHRFPVRQGLTRQSNGGMVWTGEVRLNEAALLQALKWKRPRRIFWNAHGDLFHEGVPDAAIDRLFAVCALTPQHTHMILTKRSDRMRAYVAALDDESLRWERFGDGLGPVVGWAKSYAAGECYWPLSNVWLGVSVEDRPRWDERVPDLRATPAAVRFISGEPLLGPLGDIDLTGIDWVIAGMESGPKARPGHPDWARSLRDQCAAASVAFLFKQWGEWAPRDQWSGHLGGGRFEPMTAIMHDGSRCPDDAVPQDVGAHRMAKVGKKRAGRLLDGVEHNGFPA